MRPDPAAVEAMILQLTAARGPAKSICPSEAARALADDWRPLLGEVRGAATRLAKTGRIDILRKGHAIDPQAIHGVIRLRIRAQRDDA
jgi:hypothetical protein